MKEYKYSLDSLYQEKDGFTTDVNTLIRKVCANLGFSELGICVESIRRRLSEEPDMLKIALETRFDEGEDEDSYLLRHPDSHASEYWGLIPEFTVESAIQDVFLEITGDHAADEYLRKTVPKPMKNELLSHIEHIHTRSYTDTSKLYKSDVDCAFFHTVRMTDGQVFTFRDVLSDQEPEDRSVLPGFNDDPDIFISSAHYKYGTLVWHGIDYRTDKFFDHALRRAEITAFLIVCLYHGHSYNCPTAKLVSKSHYNTVG